MRYKTIILELIQQRPELHGQLAGNRKLLSTVEHFAGLLKRSHQAWIKQLNRAGLEMEEPQLSSEAMELALEQIRMPLLTGLEPDETEPLSLDDAMQFLRKRQPEN